MVHLVRIKFFGNKYEINDLGRLTQIVGMGATQTDDHITLIAEPPNQQKHRTFSLE
jgi:hypothetical protein